MNFFKRKSATCEIVIREDDKQFKSINDTYLYTFLLTLSCMYPNPRIEHKRKIVIACVILGVIPGLLIICYDMRLRILNDDKPNFMRQSIIMVSSLFVIIKMLSTLHRSKEFRGVIDYINNDYEKFNNYSEDYKEMVKESIKKTKTLEKVWLTLMSLTSLTYPTLAFVCTIYSILCTDEPKRYLMHEVVVPFLPAELTYQSPFYELLTLYSCYILLFVFLGFTGFDGMFTVCTIHVSLKINIFSADLNSLLVNVDNIDDLKRKIGKLVRDHCEIMRLISEIQKCFEVWLVGVFFNAVLQIGMALIQVTNNKDSSANGTYYFFALATIVHLYLPCSLASDITHKAAEIANVAYCCSWEAIEHKDIRRSIAFIIAKAQDPIHFEAFGMLTFNMEMFASVLQTTYSMYTLMRT